MDDTVCNRLGSNKNNRLRHTFLGLKTYQHPKLPLHVIGGGVFWPIKLASYTRLLEQPLKQGTPIKGLSPLLMCDYKVEQVRLLRVCLRSTYFYECENFLLKVL